MIRVVFNQKGGVGKSTICSNLAAIAGAQGKRTLIIDLDSQCNTSAYLLGNDYDVKATAAEFFEQTLNLILKGRPVNDFICKTDFTNLSIMPASELLGELIVKLEQRHKIYKLRDAVAKLKQDFDEIYIDTPPAFNFYSLSALIAADTCLIPFDCDDFSRRGLYSLLANIEETRQDHNDKLRVEGIVVNQFQGQASLPKKLVEELRSENLPILDTLIHSSVKVKESHNISQPLINCAPKHKVTLQFCALYDEISA